MLRCGAKPMDRWRCASKSSAGAAEHPGGEGSSQGYFADCGSRRSSAQQNHHLAGTVDDDGGALMFPFRPGSADGGLDDGLRHIER